VQIIESSNQQKMHAKLYSEFYDWKKHLAIHREFNGISEYSEFCFSKKDPINIYYSKTLVTPSPSPDLTQYKKYTKFWKKTIKEELLSFFTSSPLNKIPHKQFQKKKKEDLQSMIEIIPPQFQQYYTFDDTPNKKKRKRNN